jgi:hypothetical protein
MRAGRLERRLQGFGLLLYSATGMVGLYLGRGFINGWGPHRNLGYLDTMLI